MKIFDLTLLINETEKIIINLQNPIDQVDCCYRADIIISQKYKQLLLSNEPIFYAIKRLRDLLKKALNHTLPLHQSIENDIGYQFNEYHYDENSSHFALEIDSDQNSYWTGYNYHLWEAEKNNSRHVTWIYNNCRGEIIFEITPCYPYMYCEPEEEPDYIPYHEWIKTYKPYLIKTIPRATAQKWLTQTEHIINIIEDNIRRWEMENDNENT